MKHSFAITTTLVLMTAGISQAHAYVCGVDSELKIPAVQFQVKASTDQKLTVLPAAGEVQIFQGYGGFGDFQYMRPYSVPFQVTSQVEADGTILYTSTATTIPIHQQWHGFHPFCHDMVSRVFIKVNTASTSSAVKNQNLAVGVLQLGVQAGQGYIIDPVLPMQSIELSPTQSIEGTVTAVISDKDSEFVNDADYKFETSDHHQVDIKLDRSGISVGEKNLVQQSLEKNTTLKLFGQSVDDDGQVVMTVSTVQTP